MITLPRYKGWVVDRWETSAKEIRVETLPVADEPGRKAYRVSHQMKYSGDQVNKITFHLRQGKQLARQLMVEVFSRGLAPRTETD